MESLPLQDSFEKLAKSLISALKDQEQLSLAFDAEDSFYLRLNQSKVRHAFTVEQGNLTLQFIKNQRRVTHVIPFKNDHEHNYSQALSELEKCRSLAEGLPIDPYCPVLEKSTNGFSHEIHKANLLSSNEWFDQVLPLFKGNLTDCAGLLTAGKVIRGVYDSVGQHHWFCRDNFNLDISFYTPAQKAVKLLYSHHKWLKAEVEDKLSQVQQQLQLLDQTIHVLKPGKYRTYFAPQAVAEFIHMFSWHGLSASSFHKGESAFKLLADNHNLSAKVTLSEDFSIGLSPRFNSLGEVAPVCLELIKAGRLENWLTSTRTAKEYHMTSGQAEEHEGLRSANLSPGCLPTKDVLKILDTGLYISNLHYLNWSDLNNGRMTGMTRYACFWVENGQIKAPIQDLRFDETLYHFLGDGLVDLTDTAEIIPDTSTYDQRSVGGIKVPGLVVNEFNYTL
jgi:predicted Zn-dependent protease